MDIFFLNLLPQKSTSLPASARVIQNHESNLKGLIYNKMHQNNLVLSSFLCESCASLAELGQASWLLLKLPHMENEIDKLAKIIWDYHLLNHQPKKADCILVLGSHDQRVAERGADLFFEGYAPFLVFSGGFGNLTRGIFDKPEADLFAEIAVRRGVPEEKILIENKSANTGENIEFTKNLLKAKGLDFNSFIVVQKPYMERRTYATFRKVWPEKEITVTSPQIAYENYPSADISKDDVINIIVGDLQRIKIYPEKGFQVYQEIPDSVWSAFQRLVALGYIRHLIRASGRPVPPTDQGKVSRLQAAR